MQRLNLLVTAYAVSLSLVSGCRWALYAGDLLSASSIVEVPTNSLKVQTVEKPYIPQIDLGPNSTAFLRNHDVNRDGVGLAWRVDASVPRMNMWKTGRPATLSETPPLQLDPELAAVTGSVKTRLLFAHLRAATTPSIDAADAHPFSSDAWWDNKSAAIPNIRRWKNLVWMHNGGMAKFQERRADVLQLLSPDLRQRLQGNTDSELLFALFYSMLGDPPHDGATPSLQMLKSTMRRLCMRLDSTDRMQVLPSVRSHCAKSKAKPFVSLQDSNHNQGLPPASSLNFAVTDGTSFAATRFRTCGETPPSLYYAHGARWTGERMLGLEGSLIVSSEPLSRDPSLVHQWTLLPEDSMIAGTLDLRAEESTVVWSLQCLSDHCDIETQRKATQSSSRTNPVPMFLLIVSLMFYALRSCPATVISLSRDSGRETDTDTDTDTDRGRGDEHKGEVLSFRRRRRRRTLDLWG